MFRGNARLATRATQWHPALRVLTDWHYGVRVARYLIGLPVPMETEDRRVLEQVIFPYFLSLDRVRSILFVGCAWYTKHYEPVFFLSRMLWTIDPDPHARKFGARQHIVAPLEELERHFALGHFDLILCNGVYGFGLDTLAQCERAFEACHACLRPGGYFLLGWDDIPARTPVPLAEVASLRRFKPFVFPPLGAARYTTDTPYRHTYDFYCA